jgi:uncharacterized protein (UPF0261 family)
MTNILLLATIDTKGQEAFYLRDKIKSLDARPAVMDISMRPAHEPHAVDITAARVAAAGGGSLEVIAGSREMIANMRIMSDGARTLVRKLVEDGAIDAVIGIGGCTGTLVVTAALHSLPFGLPKVMVSSAAAQPGLANQFFRTSDILLFDSVIELAGLSDPVTSVLDRAAHCVCAMARTARPASLFMGEKTVALTMMSPCEATARRVRNALEAQGWRVVGFHADGTGDRAMEEMIAEGLFQGVVDLAPGAVGEHLYGYMRDAGPGRLESAGRRGIPQIVSTCGVNHATPSRSRSPAEFLARSRFDLDRFRTWLRMAPDELRQVAGAFAAKLNRSRGPVKVIVPCKGWSSVDVPGSPTYDPSGDAVFVTALRDMLKKEIEIVEVDANMEDVQFAGTLSASALAVFRRWKDAKDRL